MNKKIETGLIVVKDDIFTKMRKSLFSFFFGEENKLLDMVYEMERPRNKTNGNIIIPKEIKLFNLK